MRHRYQFILGLGLLLLLTGLVIWQGSFSMGDYGPTTPEQTYVFWGLSTLIFLFTVLLAFMLFRDAVKLFVARRAGREGSRIRTKIVIGALSLTILPSLFLVLWGIFILNRNLDKWFSRPGETIKLELSTIGTELDREASQRADALARWVADSADLDQYLAEGNTPVQFFGSVCAVPGVEEAHLQRADGGRIVICQKETEAGAGVRLGKEVEGRAPAPADAGVVVVRLRLPLDLSHSKEQIDRQIRDYDKLAALKRQTRFFYYQLLLLITLFVLFVATWVALFLARQITGPVSALLDAARAVRGGNLSYRIQVAATDELASLVRAFNEMTRDLAANREELEARRRFIEAVLESIPTGVISLAHDGSIQLGNNALKEIFPESRLRAATRLNELVPPENQSEFARLLKRARRTGRSNRQIDLVTPEGTRHLSVTVSALEAKVNSGFVMVLEDTSELLHAQKAAAWHEVARRIAHELKNPLTPIALSSDRIQRQLERVETPPEVRRIIHECCATIRREVDSVKNLVDEFSQFARFPAAQPAPADLNSVVEDGLKVFEGRLDDILIHQSLSLRLPAVALDREQFKRVIVNLVDNAAEAMRDAPVRELHIATHMAAPDTVELVVADTGCGITTADKEKLFLPYFSTKQHGTGLGLAIVSHIVAEHHAQIRVEDNVPVGARFIIELPALPVPESEPRPEELHA
jgi:two-component system nitrogen regulation sensor histidine kinase NtrY